MKIRDSILNYKRDSDLLISLSTKLRDHYTNHPLDYDNIQDVGFTQAEKDLLEQYTQTTCLDAYQDKTKASNA